MTIRTWARCAVLLTLLLFVISPVAQSAAQTPTYGGHFRRMLGSDPGNLDPAGPALVRADAVRMNIFDSLLRLDLKTLDLTPGAAESWSVSDDGRTITFRLRRGLKFHNGREMVADDVKYSIERILMPETASPRVRAFDRITGAKEFIAKQARDVTGIRVLDRYRLSVTNTVVDCTFPLTFTGLFIAPKEEVERLGREFGQRPVGSGPFIFERWSRDDSVLLRANTGYWEGRPYLAALEFRIIPDPATAQAEFDTGRLEFLLLQDPNYRRYADDPKWKDFIIEVPELFTRHVGFNVTKPPLNDVRVRQALNHAVDKATIVRTVLQGKAFPATGVFPPSHPAYNRNLRGYDYNPARARELLAAAGLAGGFDLELNGSSSPVIGRWMEAIQRYWAEVGVRVRISQQDFGVLLDRAGKGEVPTYVLSHGGGPNAVNYLEPFRSRNFGPPGNRMFYKNDRVDQLLDRAERTCNQREQIRLAQEAEGLIVADAPWFFFNYNKAVLVHQPNVRGLVSNPTEMDFQPMHKVWIVSRR